VANQRQPDAENISKQQAIKSSARKLEFKDSSDAAKFAAKIADERNAEYIKILDVGPRLVITDYFVIIGANNPKLTRRIAEDIEVAMKKYGLYPIHVDGRSEGIWILMDYDEFVIHIFTEEYRMYYDLERLWRDSKIIRIKAGSKQDAKIDTNIEVEDS
jgi:ribosome-associated protein